MNSKPKSLEEFVNYCTVRINLQNQPRSGTGFFVAPGHVLTCNHVVNMPKVKDSDITIQWRDLSYPATVKESFSDKDYPDLALLEVTVTEHPCVYLCAEVDIDDPLYTFGYTHDYPNGDSVTFAFEGITGIPKLLKLKGGQVVQGLSGSPILNRRTGGVCGMLKRSRDLQSDLGGRGIPVTMIFEYMRDVEVQQKKFHFAHPLWRSYLTQEQSFLFNNLYQLDHALHELPPPGEIVNPDSQFYITRESDKLGERLIGHPTTITIYGPAGTGKSSLLARMCKLAKQKGIKVAHLQFDLFDFNDPTDFYYQFCFELAECLEVKHTLDEYWKSDWKGVVRLKITRFIEKQILQFVNQPILIAIDNIDQLIEADLRAEARNDFFRMLRGWSEKRSSGQSVLWQNVYLVLVISTSPDLLIDDSDSSPFVGPRIKLDNFTKEQVAELNLILGQCITSDEEFSLVRLLNGHPYLTQQAFYKIIMENMTCQNIIAEATDLNGPFGIHLQRYIRRLHDHRLTECLVRILHGQDCDKLLTARLEKAGLVRKTEQGHFEARCELYANFFKEKLYV